MPLFSLEKHATITKKKLAIGIALFLHKFAPEERWSKNCNLKEMRLIKEIFVTHTSKTCDVKIAKNKFPPHFLRKKPKKKKNLQTMLLLLAPG